MSDVTVVSHSPLVAGEGVARCGSSPSGKAAKVGILRLAITKCEMGLRAIGDHTPSIPFPRVSLSASSLLPPQLHLTCTCLVFRSCRQCSHCVTGLPFFLISKRGLSV